MKQHTHRSLLACAATLALTLPLAPTAHAQVMAQSKVSVSGLKITLIDLNTTDGDPVWSESTQDPLSVTST
ncbi:MAG: hypothetical protein RLZZ182_2668, partial [Pseudomonadota bacterium]